MSFTPYCPPIIGYHFGGQVFTFREDGPHVVAEVSYLFNRQTLLISDQELDQPETLTCPLTLALFEDPVIENQGHTFERTAIEEHMQRTIDCPLSIQ